MGHIILLSLLGLTGVTVEVKPLSGPAVSGQLVELNAQAATVQTAAGPQSLPVAGLWELTPNPAPAPPKDAPAVWIELIDGSSLQAAQFTVTQGVAAVTWAGGPAASIPTRAIRTVRWRDHSQTADVAKQWQEMVAQKLDADLVVVRRTGNLDQLEGVLHDVTAESVQFEVSGKRIDVSRKKLDGLVYYHPATAEVGARLCQVVDASGSQWNVQTVRLVEGRVEWTSAAGVKHALPAEQIARLNFSSANTVWLSDLEPESVQWRPYVDSQAPQPLLVKLFQPRKDRGFSGEPLVLGGTTYSRGLAIRSRTELVYRLTEAFRQFHAVVGIDDHVRDAGNVDVTLTGDERVLWTKSLTGRDAPVVVDLDLTGVKRLKILVDFGQELDIADHLNLCEARLNK